MNKLRKHIPVLDGVRGLAVLMVMAFHYPKQPLNLFERLVARVSMPGQTGVDLFFVLSGFLITGILLDAKGSANGLRNFYARRVLRIFPLYYGVLAVLFFLLPAASLLPTTPIRQQLWFWTYLQNVGFTFTNLPGPNHFWSLAVEEQFYLLWPLLVIRWDVGRIIRSLVGAIVISIVARCVLISLGYGTFYFTLCRLDGLALGGLLAIAARSKRGLSRLAPYARWCLYICTVPMGVAYVLLSGSRLDPLQVVKSTAIGILYAALIIIALTARPKSILPLIFNVSPLRSIGKYSYAMYIFHPFVFGMVFPVVRHQPLIGQMAVAGGITYVCALLSWYTWEYPFMQLKRRFESARESVAGEVGEVPVLSA